MRALRIAIATLTVLAIVLLFNSDIAIDTVKKIKPNLSLIKPNSPPIKGDPVYDEALDDHKEDVNVAEEIPAEDKEEAVTEKIIDGDIIILPPREPTLVDGTKKATTIRDRFILGAVAQYGVTNSYNGAYKRISYPNGDVDISTGVCTDVIVRAFRAVDIDLQQEMHRDMKRNFGKYPKKWGLRQPDRNIDHRRVPNMEVYFKRKGYKIPVGKQGEFSTYLPGDLVVWRINNDLTHIGIVSDQKVPETSRYYIIHNPFQGVEISDWLAEFEIINHFRMFKD
ncbi:MAG TPA: DUF1287 domain-containing protein [Leucothrix mucor]|uniref:DUF1287 domain-containing protein n=1 Tax=Leucothrix mucor TaxID=45248 RepID=A0A7V2WTM6_LEUMU|nr:DUF1287 domain-containing protein [Leucothrix mucor]